MNENEFVFWKLVKWILEDYLLNVTKCYFYCTERQKEYSKIFFYRKTVWNMVMSFSI